MKFIIKPYQTTMHDAMPGLYLHQNNSCVLKTDSGQFYNLCGEHVNNDFSENDKLRPIRLEAHFLSIETRRKNVDR